MLLSGLMKRVLILTLVQFIFSFISTHVLFKNILPTPGLKGISLFILSESFIDLP